MSLNLIVEDRYESFQSNMVTFSRLKLLTKVIEFSSFSYEELYSSRLFCSKQKFVLKQIVDFLVQLI